MLADLYLEGINPTWTRQEKNVKSMRYYPRSDFVQFTFSLTCIVWPKVIMQGKLIAVAYTLRTYWNQFSLGGICKQE